MKYRILSAKNMKNVSKCLLKILPRLFAQALKRFVHTRWNITYARIELTQNDQDDQDCSCFCQSFCRYIVKDKIRLLPCLFMRYT